MSNFLGEGGLRPCKEGVLQSWSFDGWNEFTLGTSSWSVFSQLFFLFIQGSCKQVANSKYAYKNIIIIIFIIVMYDIVKGLYSSDFAHIIAFFFRVQFLQCL